jgi:hypothetical protein
MSNGFEEAGRRIKAAVISYLKRDKGVDRTLKEMGDEDPGEYWSDQAEKLVRTMNTEVVERLHRTKKDSNEIVQ